MTLEKINSLSPRDAVTLFRQCCGSLRWAQAMGERRPFGDEQQLFGVAEEVWDALAHDDWKEAFARHPRIGDIKSLRKKFTRPSPEREGAALEWAKGEQAGAEGASEKVLKALVEGNNLYEAKFGFIFIVCATGKSAEEMLSILNQRLSNMPTEEIRTAANEQAKITRIRLEKLLSSAPGS
ncbi:MAG TPA: 2-oxo-4-hydroxy-4-carboxy-5-ureidoimidazoline decarboxylase [Bacteroidota bacterium]|jgi:2-oxo-4-hydroxy-4-carboxy-5-ureidoimidazoline decarboxylase|nr:2-oxo-4-hydroxy-4-carboxy-5-ureidoimidazoline decarboxylase [Bacteroidota bacterium]